MSHRICNIHVATSRFPIQRLLAWHISICNSYSSRGCQGLPRHTIMWNSLCSTLKSRSDSGEHWKGATPFVSHQCFPNRRSVPRYRPACTGPWGMQSSSGMEMVRITAVFPLVLAAAVAAAAAAVRLVLVVLVPRSSSC